METLTLQNCESAFERHKHWCPINLLGEDNAWFRERGRERNENGKKRGWVSKTGDITDVWHTQGIAGEWAVSMLYNLPIGRITGSTKHELNQGDISDWIEVKTNSNPGPFNRDLCVNADHLKAERSYVLVLTCLMPRWLVIVGWSWGSRILKDGRVRQHGTTQHRIYALDPGLLNPPLSLFDEIRKRSPLKHS